MINILIDILIFGLILYAIYWILGMISLPQQVKNIVLIVIGIIALIYLLQLLGVALPAGR